MKTAMQELFEKYELFPLTEDGDRDFLKYLTENREKLLEKERQQILDSYFNGKVDRQPDNFIGKERTGEQYYNETFES